MIYPTSTEIKEQTKEILNNLSECPKELQYLCNDGFVSIDPVNLNFTYGGKFGEIVLNNAIKNRINGDDKKRLINLANCILFYSMNYSPFNVLITKN
jgi:hypothetical protein